MQLSTIAKDLLINLLCVCVVFFLVYVYNDRKPRTEKQRLLVLMLCAGLGIMSCMLFASQLNENFRMDLRQIPFMIGGLYGGALSASLLAAVTIGYRFLLGGQGVYSALIIVAGQLAGLYILRPYFRRMTTYKRVMVTVTLSVISSLYIMLVMWLSLKHTLPTREIWVWYVLIPAVGTGALTYMMESMEKAALLRAEIVRAEKMSLVSHMAASISHEVRNPLTVVRGMLQLLQHEDFDPEKRTMFLCTSITELDRAEGIIRDYLAFAKPMPDKLQYLDVAAELRHTLTMLQPLANMNGVEIAAQIDAAAAVVHGERQRLQQCFLNIMKNCLEAMPKGGRLTVSAVLQETSLVVQIQDTGVGMTKEQIARMGEPYFSTKESGTGLGMMVVFSIIEAMHGYMKIESEPGRGSRFIITFPLAVAYPAAAAAVQSPT